jgi:hypothetical protein
MAITVGVYSFEGPYEDTSNLEDRSGVYVIFCFRDGKYYVVDVGESAKVKDRVDNHDRSDCWKKNCTGTLMVAVHYTPNLQQAGRMEIEQAIRDQYNPPCGER